MISSTISLSIVFVAIVLSIVEAGLLIFILKVYHKSNKHLQEMFMLTFVWGIFLLLNTVSHHFDIDKIALFSIIIGTVAVIWLIVIFRSLYNFYNRYLLSITLLSAFFVILCEWFLYYYPIADPASVFIFSIIPPLLSYFMFMEATIKTIK